MAISCAKSWPASLRRRAANGEKRPTQQPRHHGRSEAEKITWERDKLAAKLVRPLGSLLAPLLLPAASRLPPVPREATCAGSPVGAPLTVAGATGLAREPALLAGTASAAATQKSSRRLSWLSRQRELIVLRRPVRSLAVRAPSRPAESRGGGSGAAAEASVRLAGRASLLAASAPSRTAGFVLGLDCMFAVCFLSAQEPPLA